MQFISSILWVLTCVTLVLIVLETFKVIDLEGTIDKKKFFYGLAVQLVLNLAFFPLLDGLKKTDTKRSGGTHYTETIRFDDDKGNDLEFVRNPNLKNNKQSPEL